MQTTSFTSRALQVILGIISLILSSVLVKLNQNLQTQVNDLNDVIPHNYNLTTPQSSNIVSMVSSGLTLVNKGVLGTDYRIGMARNTNNVIFYKRNNYNRYGTRFIASSIPLSSVSHLGTILGSEGVENLTWFSSMILGLIKTGDWDCSDVNSLITNYNLTSGRSDFDQFIGNFLSFAGTNLELEETSTSSQIQTVQDKLLLSLSGNCRMNKANSAINVIIYFMYTITSGLVVQSLVSFIREFNSIDGSVEFKYEDPFHFPKVSKKVISP